MKAAQAKFHPEIDRLDREVAMFHGVPLATFSDDAGVSAAEDGLSFGFDRTIEDVEPLHPVASLMVKDIERRLAVLPKGPVQVSYTSARAAVRPQPRRRPAHTAAVAVGAAVSAVLVAVWTLLVAGCRLVCDRYRGWRDAPLRAHEAQRAELAAIRAGAAEEARYAEANDMPMSAEVWRLFAADETYRGEEGDGA